MAMFFIHFIKEPTFSRINTMNFIENKYMDYAVALGGLAYYITAIYYVAAAFSNNLL